ncbi:50S ribosomal protein L3 [Candidatus Woesearchaeota archaeon]|nr:50S ribosomal protein L3 [Candidatus Woesearchaeota archaeon]
MPKAKNPRHGSMQFWPRKRSKRSSARVRSWAKSKDAKLLGFAGYKAGMTHVVITDNRPNSATKGQDVSFPVTVIECPAIKVASIRFYKNSQVITEVFSEKVDKELERRLTKSKKINKKIEDVSDYDDIRLLAYTQPKLTGIKKKPEVLEIGLGGSKEDKLAYAKEKLGKEIAINEVFKEGEQLDLHAVTKGKGVQGPVKRFGVSIRHHKSEKTKRGPGSLGGWKAQGHVMYRVAFAGKMGYHLRTHYNNWVLKISDKVEEINPKGGFVRYGILKNQYILVKGSVQGSAKRLITLTTAIRPNKRLHDQAPTIQHTSLESKQ